MQKFTESFALLLRTENWVECSQGNLWMDFIGKWFTAIILDCLQRGPLTYIYWSRLVYVTIEMVERTSYFGY